MHPASKVDKKREAADYSFYDQGWRDGIEWYKSKNPVSGNIILAKDGFPQSNDPELEALRLELAEFGIDLSINQIRRLQHIVSSKERAIIKSVREGVPSIMA